jgi:hypothetical protein
MLLGVSLFLGVQLLQDALAFTVRKKKFRYSSGGKGIIQPEPVSSRNVVSKGDQGLLYPLLNREGSIPMPA